MAISSRLDPRQLSVHDTQTISIFPAAASSTHRQCSPSKIDQHQRSNALSSTDGSVDASQPQRSAQNAQHTDSIATGPDDHESTKRRPTIKFAERIHIVQKSESSVQFMDTEGHEHPDIASRPSLKKALVYASEVNKEYRRLEDQRKSLCKEREKLAHQSAILANQHSYLLESLVTAETSMVNFAHTVATLDTELELQRSLNGLRSDMKDFRDQSTKIFHLKGEVGKVELGITLLEAKLMDRIQRFAMHTESLDISSSDIGSPVYSEASGAHEAHEAQRYVPPEIDAYLDKLGDYRVLQEGLLNLEVDHQDDIAQRVLLDDQERPLAPDIARQTDDEYNQAKKELETGLRAADDAVQLAYAQCRDQGLDPGNWLDTTSDGNCTSDESSGESDQCNAAREVGDAELNAGQSMEWANSASSHLQDIDNVSQWLSGIEETQDESGPVKSVRDDGPPHTSSTAPEHSTAADIDHTTPPGQDPLHKVPSKEAAAQQAPGRSVSLPTKRNHQVVNAALDSLLERIHVGRSELDRST